MNVLFSHSFITIKSAILKDFHIGPVDEAIFERIHLY